MTIPKNTITERRKKYEEQRIKDQQKLKALQEKIRRNFQKIKKIEKKEESEREKKIGKLILKKLKSDPDFSEWFFDGIKLHLKDNTQTSLFFEA